MQVIFNFSLGYSVSKILIMKVSFWELKRKTWNHIKIKISLRYPSTGKSSWLLSWLRQVAALAPVCVTCTSPAFEKSLSLASLSHWAMDSQRAGAVSPEASLYPPIWQEAYEGGWMSQWKNSWTNVIWKKKKKSLHLPLLWLLSRLLPAFPR